jgi:hypothetical protein
MSAAQDDDTHGAADPDCEAESVVFQSLIERLVASAHDEGPATVIAEDKCAEVVERALANKERLFDLLRAMFPEKPSPSSAFFDRLCVLQGFVGFSETANRVVGHVWSAALAVSEPQTCEAILNAFANLEGHTFWLLLGTLHVVLGELELRAAFAVDFLAGVSRRVAGDAGNGMFWRVVREFCVRYPSTALQALWIMYNALGDVPLELAAFILGTLRKLPLQATDRDEFDRISRCFADHAANQFRTIFNQSWAPTAWQCGVTSAELKNLFARHDAGTIDEKSDIISAVSRSLPGSAMSSDVSELGLRWLRDNVDASISSLAKFHVVELVARLADVSQSGDQKTLGDSSDLLFAILPVAIADLATWVAVERYLIKCCVYGNSALIRVFFQLAERDPSGLHEVIRKRGFDWLMNKLGQQDIADPVGRLVVSRDAKQRQLGLYLFDKLAIETIPPAVLDESGDLGVQLAFHEFQRGLMHGESSARFLISLIPRVGSMDTEFQGQFHSELLLCARNFFGCRSELEKRAADIPMVQKALKTLSGYLEAVRRAQTSSVGAMEVPGYRRAARLFLRRFSEGVAVDVKGRSFVMAMCKSVILLYGRSFGAHVGGQLGAPTPMSIVSHQTELPVMEFSDPEGMLLRRYQILERIAELTGDQPSDDAAEEL